MAGPLPDRFQPRALIFGAIGTLAETSDLQREAFNRAFAEAGLDWHWDAETYGRLLATPGGRARIAAYAEEVGARVDAEALHAAKVRHFTDTIARDGLAPRPGVVELIAAARGEGMAVALASATTPDTVRGVVDAMRPELTADEFDFLGTRAAAGAPKPAPDIYLACLDALGVTASDAVAIEDTPESAAAAVAAGIVTYAYPGRAAEGRAFPGVMDVLDRLDPVRILAMDPCTGTRPMTERARA